MNPTPQDWEAQQTRVFTNWVNNVLAKAYPQNPPRVNNLFTDLSNGIILFMLFEALFSKRGIHVPNYNKHPKMRVHCLDNVTQALSILPQVGVMTVFLSPDQVVDGNKKMILGLIWRLILATQIVTLTTTKGVLGGDERQIDGGARAALLEWCRKRLASYNNVKIENFTTSWQNGLPFLALLHSQNPNLIDYSALDPNRPPDNLELAFTMAEKEFGIARLLDVNDILTAKPDERCIMTYVSEYAYKFDILGKPVEDKIKTLDAREQQIAMREAELERQAFEQSQQMKNLHEIQLLELQEKEKLMAQSHQQLSQMEMQQKQQLERAIAMQKEADQRMEQAARLDHQAQMANEDVARRSHELEQQRQALRAAQEQQLQQLNAKEQELAQSHQKLSAQQQQQKLELERAMQMQREAEQRLQEAQRRNEELDRRQQASAAESVRLGEYEKQLKAQADQLAAQTEALHLQQQQMSHQQQLDSVEKEFADHANAMDEFLVNEMKKIQDPNSTLQIFSEIQNFGVEHGNGLLQRVRVAAEKAGKLGLQQNRFTKHTLSSLDDRWKVVLQELKVKLENAQQRELQFQQNNQNQQQYPLPNAPQQQQYPPPMQNNSNFDVYSPGLGLPNSNPQVSGLGMPLPPPMDQQYAQTPSLGMPLYNNAAAPPPVYNNANVYSGPPAAIYNAPAPVYGMPPPQPVYGMPPPQPVYGMPPPQPVYGVQPVYGYQPTTSVVHVHHGKIKYKHKKGHGYY